MTEREYREMPGIRRSDLFKILESPEKFKYYLEHPEPPTKALAFGSLFHAMVLEPETVERDFAVAPNVDRRTKFGKDMFAKFEKDSYGKIAVAQDMVDLAVEMRDAVAKHELASKLLRGQHEVAFSWKDDITGEMVKCKVDVFREFEDKVRIVDLKSTENAETEAFTKAAINMGYDMQAAMYSKIVEQCTGKRVDFIFLAVEKKPPYAINILEADGPLMVYGYDKYRKCIGDYSLCKKDGNWYGYLGPKENINMLCLPSYLAKEII